MPSNAISHNLDSQTRLGDRVKNFVGKNLLCTDCEHLYELKPG
ncbi:hypothetical protein N9L33_01675 [Nitrospinae bacterium]|nr:hypothetical protein [Nitrospinota bacterium]